MLRARGGVIKKHLKRSKKLQPPPKNFRNFAGINFFLKKRMKNEPKRFFYEPKKE